MKNIAKDVRCGEIYYADLRPVVGSEQGGIRPVLIVQNDMGNRYSPTTIVVSLTSKEKKSTIPTHVNIYRDSANGLKSDSTVLCEQVRTIDKSRIKDKIGRIDGETLNNVLLAMKVSLNMF